MSKLLAALRQIDAKSGSTPAKQATGAEQRAPVAGEHLDALKRIAELNQLLEQALAGQRASPIDESVDHTVDKPVAPVEIASLRKPAPSPPSAAELSRPVAIATEFAELADRLLVELGTASPAVLTFVATEPGPADSSWLLPLATGLLQKHSGRLLVVEADGDEPRWTAQMGIEGKIGLVDLLEMRAAWRDCLRPTAVPRLDFLPRGRGRMPTSAESAGQLQILLEKARAEYSLVLVAAGGADRPAAAAIASKSDAVVLVVGLKTTPRSTAERAKQLLESTNARIIGAIARY